MANKNPYRPFTPDPEFAALRTGINGNEINGLGETEVRRPDMVWWATDPDTVPFGEAQKWFYRQEKPGPELLKERQQRKQILNTPLAKVAAEKIERSASDWTRALDAFVDDGDCEKTGVTQLQSQWIFSHHDVSFKNVIVVGVQHEYDKLKSAPDQVAGTDVSRQYNRAASAAMKVANWLRQQGWDATPVTGPMVGEILMIPAAIECGFGELGKHGSIINPDFGSGFRLGAVLTDAPFEYTRAQQYGIDDFCTQCRVCENACPPFAIQSEKKTVRGEHKWYVDFDKCIPFFAETSGCAICIAVCPWTQPGVGQNLAAKLARRSKRKGETNG